jgi:hypothetical protein
MWQRFAAVTEGTACRAPTESMTLCDTGNNFQPLRIGESKVFREI